MTNILAFDIKVKRGFLPCLRRGKMWILSGMYFPLAHFLIKVLKTRNKYLHVQKSPVGTVLN